MEINILTLIFISLIVGFAIGSICGYWNATVYAAKKFADAIRHGRLEFHGRRYEIKELNGGVMDAGGGRSPHATWKGKITND